MIQFYVHQIQSPHLKGLVEYILFNHSTQSAIQRTITSYANTNICLGTGMAMEDNFDGWDQDNIDWFMEAYEISRGIHWYKGDTMSFNNDVITEKLTVPLVVLFGNGTASAAEDFLVILDGIKGRATTIGQKYFGSTGQPMSFKLPGDAWARICTKKDTYPDGREFVGYGVEPDIFVPLSVAEMIGGRDDALAKGIAVLKGKM